LVKRRFPISFERLNAFLQRLQSYDWRYAAIELALIWLVVYVVFRFLKGTRAAGAVKGLLLLVVMVAVVSRVIGGPDIFQRLAVLYDRFLALVAVALIVIFQPELRRALVRLGEAPFIRATPKDVAHITSEVADACRYLSRNKFGAIIVIERTVGLKGLAEGGTILNADLTARLLQTIFFPGSALHDLAVVIKGRTVHAAGVQLPLAEPEEMPDQELGSRHRAAVGVSKEADAIVVVVSEETGFLRVAERGRLSIPMSVDDLKILLRSRLGRKVRLSTKSTRAGASDSTSNGDNTDSKTPGDSTISGQSAVGIDARSMDSLAGEGFSDSTAASDAASDSSRSAKVG
jgi:diadenylate cyclase